MKKNILKFACLIALGFIFSMVSCKHEHKEGDHSHGDHTHEMDHSKIDKSGKEYTSAYVCPMHCEGSGSDQAGTCPVCKMDLEPVAQVVE